MPRSRIATGAPLLLVVEGTSGLTANLETPMKKRDLKKLHIAKETLGNMLDSELPGVAGGLKSAAQTCTTCTSHFDLNAPVG